MAALKFSLVASAIVLLATPLTSAEAQPPPPPPAYVTTVAELLTHKGDASTIKQLSNFVADDVRAYVNDKLVASGKADWMRRFPTAQVVGGGILAHNEAWDENGGSLMVVDEYDTVDRAKLPTGFLADPRLTGRATLYQFGTDHKIHAIRTLIGGGFWIRS